VWNVDRQTLEALRAGERRAWEKVLAMCRRQVFNIAYGFAGNAEDAEDWAQEALLQVYRRIGTFRGDADLSTWVYRVTVNVCIGKIRRRKSNTSSLDEMDDHAMPAIEDPTPSILSREEEAIVRSAVAQLPPKLSPPVILHYFQGLGYDEIAKVLDIPLGTVKSRINRAKMLLKDMLKEYIMCEEVGSV
jgi:RNA polymerase sigma-70 factor (ECF subfamily)